MAETTVSKSQNLFATGDSSNPITGSAKARLPQTLKTLQFLRTARGKSDAEIHAQLSIAATELSKNDLELMLERLMLHIGDVSRSHNILKEMGVSPLKVVRRKERSSDHV